MTHLVWAASALILVSGCNEKLCDDRIIQACYGCSPYVEQLKSVANSLSPTLLTKVKRCADLSTDTSFKSAEYAKGTFTGCISTDKTIDDKSRDKLLELIGQVPVPQQQYDQWITCYAGIVNPTKSTEPTPKPKPTVVLMDSHIKDLVYCEHTQKINGSNADDIINLIKDQPVTIATVATNLEWKDDQRVIDMNPALVVVHASAFYQETHAMEGNQRLLNFLDSLKKTPIKVLVYTRGLPDQAPADVRMRWEALLAKLKDPDLAKHAELFVMPKGQQSCFDDPDVAMPFKNKIKDMLNLK